jgi:hypothetical protein
MERWINNAKLVTLGVFVVASLGITGYEMLYVWPAQHCEQHGGWWDGPDRQCLTPIPIWRITGRALAPYKAALSGSPPGPTAHPPAPAH